MTELTELKRIMKNKKAISPVLAVLLMIAVAVAAALVTYAWVMTYLSSTTSRAGHAVQIQSVAFTLGPADPPTKDDTVTIYAQNVGDGTLVITDVYLDGELKLLGVTMLPVGGITEEGTTTTITVGDPEAYLSFELGQDVYIKVVCDDGTFTSGTYTVE